MGLSAGGVTDAPQKAMIGVGYKQALQENVKQGQRTDLTCGNFTTSEPNPKSRDLAAAKVGVSGKVIDIAEKITTFAPEKEKP